MPAVRVRVRLPADELLRWYAGAASEVQARADDGRSVRFPMRLLQPWVTHDGIAGHFEIHYDATGRFTGIRRLDA
jgi:hypothetical protein